MLAAALGTWLTGLGNTVASSFNRGPALTAIADVLFDSNQYALTKPVTTVADRVTLLGGVASDQAVMSVIARHGGVAVGLLNVTLVLQGHRDSLRIVDIKPQVLTRPESAPTAAYLSYPQAGFHEFNLLITYITGGRQYEQTVPGPGNGAFEIAGQAPDYHDYGTVYWGLSGNQFEVASTEQDCNLFPRSRGC